MKTAQRNRNVSVVVNGGPATGVMCACLLELRKRAAAGGRCDEVAMIDAALSGDRRAEIRAFIGEDVVLKPRQWQIVELVWRARRDHGTCPTLREIGDALGITPVSVFGVVEELIHKGVMRKDEGQSHRALHVCKPSEREAAWLQ